MSSKFMQAAITNCQEIAALLSAYFQDLNEVIGFENYKTDYKIMLKNVQERISNPNSPFKYFIRLDDAGNLIGFVNTLEDKVGGILAVVTKSDLKNRDEISKELFHYAKEYLLSKGYKILMTEFCENEKVLEEEAKRLNARIIKKTVIMNIS